MVYQTYIGGTEYQIRFNKNGMCEVRFEHYPDVWETVYISNFTGCKCYIQQKEIEYLESHLY